MNIEQFNKEYNQLKDLDQIEVDPLCQHEGHEKSDKLISKGAAKRNISKNGGDKFICRDCFMKYNNPGNKTSGCRQTDEIITVICPHEKHNGLLERQMKKACYYGSMVEPYTQICKPCSQLGKVVEDEMRDKISTALTGIKRSDEFKENLSHYMKNNPEGIERGKNNLIPGSGGGWNKGKETPDEVKQKMSETHKGKVFTDEHRENISLGRKKMLEETGGFTQEHRENLSKASKNNYEKGFNPNEFHRRGWHISPKAGKVFYRSSYEKRAFILLDNKESVVSYQIESIKIPFYNPVKKITGTYLIDVLCEHQDGSMTLIEIKPQAFVENIVVKAKHEAAYAYAKENGIQFEIWTEIELFGPVFNSNKIQQFVSNLDSIERQKIQKDKVNKKAKKHYDTKIATDTVEFFCDFCNETHIRQRKAYDRNVGENGRFICIKENGSITGVKPKKKKFNPYAVDGKKQCNKCKSILLFEEFSPDKTKTDGYSTRCKKCRAAIYKAKYQEKKKKE